MALKKRQHGAKIGENDIGPTGKRHAVGKLLEKLNLFGAVIGGGNLSRHLNNLTRLDRIDPTGTKLAREHCENTRPRTDFHDDRSRANALSQRLCVSLHANAICDHRAICAHVVHLYLSVHRGCLCRNERHDAPGICSNGLTEVKD